MWTNSQKVLLAGIGFAATVAVALHFYNQRHAVASVYGQLIFLEDDSGAEDRQQQFAVIVQSELTSKLVSQFEIDSSRSAILEFAKSKGLDLTSPEVAMADQQRATNLANAIESVVSDAQTARDAYDEHQLASFSDFESWEVYLEEVGTADTVDSLRSFAEQPEEQKIEEEIDRLRPIYLAASIEKHICGQPSVETAISEEMRSKLGNDIEVGSESVQAVWNYECRIQAREYVRRELHQNVEVYDPALSGYDSMITFAR